MRCLADFLASVSVDDGETEFKDREFEVGSQGLFHINPPPQLGFTAFESKPFLAVTGQEIEILYHLDAIVFIENLGNTGFGTITADFSTTFGPARTGPVFNLPEGFTASGPCVENNRFVCGQGATPGPAPVSLPGTFVLLLSGLAALAWWAGARGHDAQGQVLQNDI